MKKKFMLRVMAWLLAVAMLLPSAGNVFTAYAEEGKVAYSGSVEIEGKSETWWNAVNPTLSDLLGDVKPEDVIKVVFYGDPFLPGYNTNKDGGWKQPADYVKELVADDIWFNEGFALQIGVSIAPGEKATVKWDVYTANGAGKATEEPKTPAATTGKKISLTTENTDFGATNVVAPSEFEAYKNDGVKLYIEFDQEDAPWWNLAPVTQADGWPRLAGYMLNQSANENGFIQTFSKGDSNITIELSAEGVQKIIADGGLRFQVKALKVTSVTISPLKDKPKATATPKPTATPTPVPITEDTYKTVGDVLLVTEDMVKNGTVTVERAQYNSIIIPANLKADVLLKTVKADEIVVEGGADYTVTLYRCDIDKLDVTAPEVKVMTIAELNAALNAADADTEAVIAQFQEDLAAKKAAEAARVELVTTYFTTVKELNVKASAKIDANECEVDQINLAVADVEERMNVEVEEFNGAMSADLDRAEGAFAALFMLDLEDSKLSAMDVTGADSSCFIEGKASVVDAINVADAANVTLNATTGKIVVGEKATGAKVRVYSQVNEVVVKGDANSIVLPTCAEIGNAVVEGNNVKIYGYGELESAVITGTGANVAVYGTAVEGDNDSTPPAAMIAMNPYKNLTKNERPSKPEEDEEEGEVITMTTTPHDSWGIYTNTIPVSTLQKYTNGVEITFDFTVTESYGLISLADAGDSWKKLVEYIDDVDFNDDSGEYACLGTTDTTITMTLSAEGVEKVIGKGSGVLIQGYGIDVTKATLVALADDGENEDNNEDSELVIEDNWVVANTADVTLATSTWWAEAQVSIADLIDDITAEDVKAIKVTSDTNFVLAYANSTGDSDFVDGNSGEANPWWTQLSDKNEYIVNNVNLGENGLFKICISKSDGVDYTMTWEVYVEDDETAGDGSADEDGDDNDITEDTYSVDANYTDINLVRPFYLAKFDGDITVTVEFDKIGNGYPQIKPVTSWSSAMYNSTSGTNYFVDLTEDTSGLPYYLNQWGYLYVTDSSADKISFKLSEDGVAKLMSEGGLKFQEESDGIKVTAVTLSGIQDEQCGYMGDDVEACGLSASEFSDYAGSDVAITIGYSLVEGSSYGQLQLCVVDNSWSWTNIESTDYVSSGEGTVNEWAQLTVPAHLNEITVVLKAEIADAILAGNRLAIKINKNIIMDSVLVGE